MAPGLSLLALFTVAPIVYSFVASTFEWNMLRPLGKSPFVGLGNYLQILQDDRFVDATIHTLQYALGFVTITLAVALLVAVALNSRIGGKGLYRTVCFIPVVTSMVAVSLVWTYLYNPTYGLINTLLEKLNLPAMGFLTNPNQSLFSVMAVDIWKRIGYFMIIFLAGLQGIPKDLYEAARLDGASGWHVFSKITLPMLKPTLLLCIVVATIEALRVFTPIFVMTKGGPADGSMVLGVLMYQTAFTYLKAGQASAMAVLLFVIVLAITIIQSRLMREGGLESY